MVPRKELERLQAAKEKTLHVYRSGSQLLDNQQVHEAVTLCILAAMPQSFPEVGHFKDVPVAGRGPDSIHLYLNSSSVLITTPPMQPLPSQPSTAMQLAEESIIYYTELRLKDPGTYEISAEREFANWRWAKQYTADPDNHIIRFPTGYTAYLSNATMTDHEKLAEANYVANDGKPVNPQPISPANIHPARIVVDYDLHPDLPGTARKRCSSLSGFSAEKGRWYNATEYPNLPQALADEWGFIYTPDDCILDYITDTDMTSCLANKNVHIFGDSNARRLSRAILSGGRWCHDTTLRCQSEDWGDDVQKVVWNDLFNTLLEETETPEHNGQFELNGNKPFSFGRNSTLSFSFLQSIAMVPADWLSAFYAPSDYTLANSTLPVPFDPEQIHPNAKPRHPEGQPTPDLVVIAIGAWDEAFDPAFSTFERTVPHFRDAILQAYPDVSTKLALRLSQGHCCRRNYTEDLRRFSGTRQQHFGDIMREAFDIETGHAMGGRMVVLDASGLAGRPEVVNDFGPVGSNHQRAAHSRLEAQILLNRLCERDHEGRAVWREQSRMEMLTVE